MRVTYILSTCHFTSTMEATSIHYQLILNNLEVNCNIDYTGMKNTPFQYDSQLNTILHKSKEIEQERKSKQLDNENRILEVSNRNFDDTHHENEVTSGAADRQQDTSQFQANNLPSDYMLDTTAKKHHGRYRLTQGEMFRRNNRHNPIGNTYRITGKRENRPGNSTRRTAILLDSSNLPQMKKKHR